MSSDLKLITRGFVNVRAAQHVKALDASRQGNRPLYNSARTLCGFNNLKRRLIDEAVIERFESDTNFLILHGCFLYSMTLATTPAPTVLPPSRMAKRRPCSIAIGAINVTTILMLSPGITISVPSGNCTAPVTSVVRK